MPEPRLIGSYLAILAAQLPASIVEELADGLAETHRSYLRQGLAPDLAARSAVAEFGEPRVVVAGFTRVNPARRAARKLLGIGPAVGACWIAALLTSRSWAVPVQARMLACLTLAAVIALLATSALGKRYRLAARTGAAGFLGVIALDASLIAGVALAGVPLTWVLAVAMAASAARICYAARALRPALAG
jgi:hypothetical protein